MDNTYAIAAHTDLDQVKRLSKLCPELALTRSTFDEMAVEAGATWAATTSSIISSLLERPFRPAPQP